MCQRSPDGADTGQRHQPSLISSESRAWRGLGEAWGGGHHLGHVVGGDPLKGGGREQGRIDGRKRRPGGR